MKPKQTTLLPCLALCCLLLVASPAQAAEGDYSIGLATTVTRGWFENGLVYWVKFPSDFGLGVDWLREIHQLNGFYQSPWAGFDLALGVSYGELPNEPNSGWIFGRLVRLGIPLGEFDLTLSHLDINGDRAFQTLGLAYNF